MGVLDFEAYTLEYAQIGEGYYDDNGDYNPGEEEWLKFGRVDAAPPSGPNQISLPDGHQDTFAFSIFIHNPRCRSFNCGDKIRLTNPFGETFELKVKGFTRYQNTYQIKAG